MSHIITKEYIDKITYKIIGCTIEVHRELGPGLLENEYEKCFLIEFENKALRFKSQKKIYADYKGFPLETNLRYDVLIEDLIVVELKSKEIIPAVDYKIPATYMKLLRVPKGILINFHCTHIFREGQKTIVNEHYASLPET